MFKPVVCCSILLVFAESHDHNWMEFPVFVDGGFLRLLILICSNWFFAIGDVTGVIETSTCTCPLVVVEKQEMLDINVVLGVVQFTAVGTLTVDGKSAENPVPVAYLTLFTMENV